MQIGEKIRNLRNRENLTQRQLADKVMVTQQMINKIEHGASVPGLDLAKRLAETFDCTIDELIKVG